MQKCANLVELEKCCQTHIFLQNFVLIQPRTSPPKISKSLLIFPILLTTVPGLPSRRTCASAKSCSRLGATVPAVRICGGHRAWLRRLNSWAIGQTLCRARSRSYRSQILQVNTRWKALAEIYTLHSFATFSTLKFLF